MRIALMADIHGNREAFEACLRDARKRGCDQVVLLGDYVGYGADPAWTMDRVMELVEGGARAVLGNHDRAVADLREELASDAEVVMSWTRGQLGPAARRFLQGLPMGVEEEERLYVHANVAAGRRWAYLDGPEAAGRALRDCGAQAVFCGHVHVPALYGITATGQTVTFKPVTGSPIPLLRHRRWLAVLGAVGQPRDGESAASYALLDAGLGELTYFRVPYDVQAAAAKIRAAGLPEALAVRLGRGR
ncbi:MAG: metallophosphoesterase [Holophagaceae bacterium]|nr:metallophosphoesterase [Holophagaceae bacterium]